MRWEKCFESLFRNRVEELLVENSQQEITVERLHGLIERKNDENDILYDKNKELNERIDDLNKEIQELKLEIKPIALRMPDSISRFFRSIRQDQEAVSLSTLG